MSPFRKALFWGLYLSMLIALLTSHMTAAAVMLVATVIVAMPGGQPE